MCNMPRIQVTLTNQAPMSTQSIVHTTSSENNHLYIQNLWQLHTHKCIVWAFHMFLRSTLNTKQMLVQKGQLREKMKAKVSFFFFFLNLAPKDQHQYVKVTDFKYSATCGPFSCKNISPNLHELFGLYDTV